MKKLLCLLFTLFIMFTLLSCDAGGGVEAGGTPEETTDEAPAETLPKVADTETPWYIEAWDTSKPIELPEIPEEKKNLALKVPLHYERSEFQSFAFDNRLEISVDFNQEYYLAGSPIQVKVTISNPLFYDINIGYKGGIAVLYQYDATDLSTPASSCSFASELLPTEHELEYYQKGNYGFADNVPTVVLPARGSLAFEYVFIPEESFFDLADTHTILIWVREHSSGYEYRIAAIEIPLEIVEVELSEAAP